MRADMHLLATMMIFLAAGETTALLAGDNAAAMASTKSIEGFWQGTLKVTGANIELRLVVKIAKKSDGTYTGTLDSPDQGATGIELDKIILTDGTFRLEKKALKAVFEGKFDGSTIVGQWKQGGQSLPLTFKRVAKPVSINRPQEPKKPYPYREEEVRYENRKAGAKFAGTLTLPRSQVPIPAVLLISGSGPQDRNETIFGHRPFLVLADYLTRRGIAVLRVDDRGVGGSTGDAKSATSADFAGDVLAGVAYLKSRKEINPRQIGLIGHSEGGLIAPMAAACSTDVAFIVMMAGTGLPGEEVMYLQGQRVLKAACAEEMARERLLQQRIFEVVKQEKDAAAAEKRIRELLAEETAKLSDREKKRLGDLKAFTDGQVKMVLSPWFRFFIVFNPRPTLMKVQCPVLAVNGEKDVQVAPKENLAAIAAAFKAGGNKDYTVKELPHLNHLFQTCKTGAVSEYAKIEQTIAPAALELIADWIGKHTKAQKQGTSKK